MNVLNIEECELLGDSKYRAYISQVEKALKSFESTSEWADLISALGKLNKVLASHSKYAVIPKRVTIGKRLAQCLHPALPSGVHLKALETYDLIFKCVGTQRLAADLFTYSSGLFPLLAYAAMSVKPVLLALYEKHFITLGRYIRPGLTGLLLGLLPGLEEGSEHFDRTSQLLEEFAEAAEPVFFYGCLWECVLSVPGVRLAAINFVVAHFNKKQSMEDQLHYMGTNIDVLVEGLCSSIQDTSVLVQRSALDLLLMGFPMHNSQLTRLDMAKLANAAIKVVLRRDMSLNRRLYAWLLGTDATGNPVPVPASLLPSTSRSRSDSASTVGDLEELGYFNTFSRELLVGGIKACIYEGSAQPTPASGSTSDSKQVNLRPFRILISLLDKPEVGSAILEDVLIDIFRHMYQECGGNGGNALTDGAEREGSPLLTVLPVKARRNKDPQRRKEEKAIHSEVIKTANLLFGAFEPYFMWDYIRRTFEVVAGRGSSGSTDSGVSVSTSTPDKTPASITLVELCRLIEFLLDKVALETYPETQTEHLPELLRQVILALSSRCSHLSDEELTHGLQLCSKLLTRVLPSMTPVSKGSSTRSNVSSPRRLATAAAASQVQSGTAFDSEAEEDTVTQVSGSEDYLSADSDAGIEKDDPDRLSTVDATTQDTTSFTDFVQYDEHRLDMFSRFKPTPRSSPSVQRKSAEQGDENITPEATAVVVAPETESNDSQDSHRRAETLMQSCMQCFQLLFSTLVHTRILPDTEVADMLASQLHCGPDSLTSLDLPRVHVPPPSPQHRRRYTVVNLLEGDTHEEAPQVSAQLGDEVYVLPLEHLSVAVTDAFTCACQLLVDFSCFPMYRTKHQRAFHSSLKKGNMATFPEWLKLLLTCACFVSNFSVQQAAICTLLDLISLTQSLVTQEDSQEADIAGKDEEEKDESADNLSSCSQLALNEGTMSVVMLPSLAPHHLRYLNTRTNFFRIVSTHLWNYLSETSPAYHQRSVDLLHQLHQLAPTPWVCEDVIGNALLSDSKGTRLSAHKKFAVLWHLLRERQPSSNPTQPFRTFDRSMFLMLDSLQSDVNPCRALTQTWLTHSIQRGDIARILEPVLLMLLHPDTARISIQHVNIHEPRKVRISESASDVDHAETKIYAISSEGGNIIYHVSNQGRPFSTHTNEELRSYALTTIAEGAVSGTRLACPKADTDLPFERINASDLNLRVNPFGSESSLDKVIFEGYEPPPQLANMRHVRRLTAETCKKEGIFFDDIEQLEEEEEEPEVAEEATDHLDGSKVSKESGKSEVQVESTPEAVVEEHSEIQKSAAGRAEGQTEEVSDDHHEGSQAASSLPNESQKPGPQEEDSMSKPGSHVDATDGRETREVGDNDEAESKEQGHPSHVSAEEVEEVLGESPEEIVRALLEELIDLTVKQEEERVVLQGIPESNSDTYEDAYTTERWAQQENPFDMSHRTQMKKYAKPNPEGSTTQGAGSTSSQGGSAGALATGGEEEIPGIHPLHTHILLYTQKFDAQRTLYALTCLKSILTTTPRLVTCAMATTSISNALLPHLTQLQHLLARHRRSVFGKNFFSEVPGDALSGYRTSMYLEILISVSLYYIRSYYPNLMMSKLTEHELNGNKEVQILSCEILTLLLSELVNVAKDSGKGFSTYIGDLLGRCKVQKALLHCLLASVYNARLKPANQVSQNLTEAIISFNEENMDANTNETFQIKLLKLILVLVLLEDQIRKAKGETDGSAGSGAGGGGGGGGGGGSLLPSEWEKARQSGAAPTLTSVRYVQSRPIVYQTMLLSAVLSALKQQHLCHMHRHWIAMVTSALPYLGRALSHTVVAVVNQLCHNLEMLAVCYERGSKQSSGILSGTLPTKVPPDHLVTLLEGLTTMSHFCVLDASQQDITIGQHMPTSSNNIVNDTATAGQILSNLIHVFNPYSNNREPSPAKEVTSMVPPVMEARRSLLSILPRILASLTALWKAINISEAKFARDHKEQSWWTLGSPKTVRQYILEFVSPISRHHGVNMLGAIAVVWNDRRQRRTANPLKKVISPACPDQLLLVELVGAIKVLPTDTLMQTVRQVIKQPPATSLDKQRKRTPLEVSMLQFFYSYMQRTPGVQLVDSWPSFVALLREGLQLNLIPPGQFLLLAILNEFVQKIPQFEERKDQKDVQDIAQKLLEACSEIAGASLEQTTWLRRNLAVKPGPQVDVVMDPDDIMSPVEVGCDQSTADMTMTSSALIDRQYSVQALVMLADLMAPLLDVVYSSEEKDRVLPLLNSIMLRVFPYLRNHSPHNLPSFRACSQILASLSSYQYTRKAWRKEAFEMLLDTAFFQMDTASIACWHTIIDNLMTHDKTTFKDLLARVTVAPSSMNLFSSRDQEFENRAQLLKRFSYTIFCSELDQYQKHMPDIQERLADSLRTPSVPSVQAQVFNCFRVLVLRMSPQHLTSLWPTVITELVHVLLQIEQEMIPDVEESRTHLARMANLDTSWALGNGLCAANNNPSCLNLYLAACKLLDLALVLPTDVLPQFQLYRWAFVGDPGIDEPDTQKQPVFQEKPGFVPHVLRITRLMTLRFGPPPVVERVPGLPILTSAHLRAVQDLHGFFNTIISQALISSPGDFHKSSPLAAAAAVTTSYEQGLLPKSKSAPEFRSLNLNTNLRRTGPGMSGNVSARQQIEYLVETDFLEPMPKPSS